jgi:ribosome biogenesis SPOUT family RNA methylase Rps3
MPIEIRRSYLSVLVLTPCIMPKFIIEHLEEELYDWCILEYKNMSKIVGKNNLMITNIKKPEDQKKLSEFAEVKAESVLDLNISSICLLDMDAEKELSPNDNFENLVFGGILGDDPPQKRTIKFLASLKAEKRHLGKKQMATDNAVLTAKLITGGKKLSEIKFIDNPSINMEDGLDLELPYRFVEVNGKPYISDELLFHIKKSGF